jgi:hypothetical protein
MNRELKFRVYSHVKDDDSGHGYLETDSGEYHGAYFFFDGGWRPVVMFFNKEHFAPQQYTGCKDKNGVEIYEGDIIHYKFNGDSYPKEAVDRILTCSYDEDEGMYSFDDSDHSYYWAEIKRHSNIIGNIYENPELLKA